MLVRRLASLRLAPSSCSARRRLLSAPLAPHALPALHARWASSSSSSSSASSSAASPPQAQPLLLPQAPQLVQQSQQAERTFYRRELPPHLASFTSAEGRALFRKALLAGHAEIFYSLSGNFTMQSEPAFCGLGSLAMVLNSLSVDPGKKWKGVWRWYADDMLECCAPLDQIKKTGMTFQELACVARCNGLDVVSKSADAVDFDEFVQDLASVTASSETHMVVSFSRKALSQTGDGHFSPVGAFVPDTQQVLVMDTARFKYPSYFVDARMLYEAMRPIDAVTGLSRGYFILRKGQTKPLSLCQIIVKDVAWRHLRDVFQETLPRILRTPSISTTAALAAPESSQESKRDLIRAVIHHLPADFLDYTAFRSAGHDLAGSPGVDGTLQSHLDAELHALCEQGMSHPLFPIVHAALMERTTRGIDARSSVLATIFLLSLPSILWAGLPSEARRILESYRKTETLADKPLLREEVGRLADQWDTMLNSNCTCGRNTWCAHGQQLVA